MFNPYTTLAAFVLYALQWVMFNGSNIYNNEYGLLTEMLGMKLQR